MVSCNVIERRIVKQSLVSCCVTTFSSNENVAVLILVTAVNVIGTVYVVVVGVIGLLSNRHDLWRKRR